MKKILATMILTAATFAVGAAAAEADDFYAGKRITVLINYSAGGPTDIEGRFVMQHLQKHIPGNPEVIVKNMPGAGGLVATNYLGEGAEKDGLTVAYFTAVYEYQLLEDPALRIDLRDLGVVGGVQGVPVNYIRKDVAPGMEKPEDIVKAEAFLAGGLRPTISKDLLIRMPLDMLGVPHRVITGFKGNAPARQAVQQNEIQYYSETLPAYRSVVAPTMVETGMVIPVFSHEIWVDGKPVSSPDVPEGIPTFYELYEKVKGEQPHGQLLDAYNVINKLSTNMLRLIALPPGAPKEALDDLRTALKELSTDKAFAADAEKALKFVPTFVIGQDAETMLKEQLDVDEDIRTFLKDYVAKAQ